jgi:hypothetical protein
MQGIETGEGKVSKVGAADEEFRHPFAEQRRAGEDVGADLGAPITLLVPREQMAAERQGDG